MAHFYSTLPDGLNALTHQEAVKRYIEERNAPRQGLAGLSTEELNSHPVPGTWSIQQILIHLMDTDLIACYRMKRIIAEDRPELDLYDETAFAERLYPHKLEASLACEVFRINRMVMGTLLRQLPDDVFDRVAIHPEVGEMSLGLFVRLYIHHLDHHSAFIRQKRRLIRQAR